MVGVKAAGPADRVANQRLRGGSRAYGQTPLPEATRLSCRTACGTLLAGDNGKFTHPRDGLDDHIDSALYLRASVVLADAQA